jgi:DNA-3-methyladenine glycosylase
MQFPMMDSPLPKPLSRSFFARPTLDIAPDLLGRMLLVADNGTMAGGRIVEVEAYVGEDDPACHACRGKTQRNAVMYGPPGHAYVYFTYGNHWMLNAVTEREDFPAAVLIRAIEPMHGLDAMHARRGPGKDKVLTNGPGKLAQALGLTGDDNGVSLRGPRILIGGRPPRNLTIATSGRVGVIDAADIPWRFYIDGHPCVSPYRPGRPASRRRPAVS